MSGMAFAVTWPTAIEAGLARDAALALAMVRQASIPGLRRPTVGSASHSMTAISGRASGVNFAAASSTSRHASQESQPHPFLA